MQKLDFRRLLKEVASSNPEALNPFLRELERRQEQPGKYLEELGNYLRTWDQFEELEKIIELEKHLSTGTKTEWRKFLCGSEVVGAAYCGICTASSPRGIGPARYVSYFVNLRCKLTRCEVCLKGLPRGAVLVDRSNGRKLIVQEKSELLPHRKIPVRNQITGRLSHINTKYISSKYRPTADFGGWVVA